VKHAIGTLYLRCSILEAAERNVCRDQLRRYTSLRVAAYDAYGRHSDELSRVLQALDEGEQIQAGLWTIVARATRANPDPPHTLLMHGLNEVIDLDAERRAAIRIVVPRAVNAVITFACLAWAALLGYTSGARRVTSWTAWVVVTLLICAVFGVALDLDQPRAGFIRTTAAELTMEHLLRSMQGTPLD
jgi:hypothetical protein